MPNQSPSWAEPLPAGCPPSTAQPPSGQTFYRLVAGFPVTPTDFWSPYKLDPQRVFKPWNTPCEIRSLTIFLAARDCEKNKYIKPFRNFRIAVFQLGPEAGVVQHSPRAGQPTHHSWWMYQDFDPIPGTSQHDDDSEDRPDVEPNISV
jgi:hypothetical protein